MALFSVPISDTQEIGDSLPILNEALVSLDSRFNSLTSNTGYLVNNYWALPGGTVGQFVNIGGDTMTGSLTINVLDASVSLSAQAGVLAAGNMLVGQNEGGSYFGRTGVTENQVITDESTVGKRWNLGYGTNKAYRHIAVSSDGRVRTAVVYGGQISVSVDQGVTWTDRGTSRNWNCVAMSTDGKIQVAVADSSQIYVSKDYGTTWVAYGTSRNYKSVAVSSDGKIQTVTVTNGFIYVSTDYGATWSSDRGVSRQYTGVAMSSNGKYQTVAAANTSRLYTSTDYGVTWTLNSSAPAREWYAVAMSSDGKYQTAASYASMGGVNADYLYTSNDYGNTWTKYSSAKFWTDIAMSSNGRVQVATVEFDTSLYLSTNYGVAWSTYTLPSSAVKKLAVSSDAKTIVAVVDNGKIFESYAESSIKGTLYTGQLYVSKDPGSLIEGGQINFGRSFDNAPSWAIDSFSDTPSLNSRLRIINNAANVELVTVLSGGEVGIGTFAPDSKLHVVGNAKVVGKLTILGDLSSTGTQTFANTVFATTSALSVVNLQASGPALYIGANGTGDIASFYDIDQNVEVLHVGGSNGSFPNVGVKTSSPTKDFTVNGEISSNNIIWDKSGNSSFWNTVTQKLPLSGGRIDGLFSVHPNSLGYIGVFNDSGIQGPSIQLNGLSGAYLDISPTLVPGLGASLFDYGLRLGTWYDTNQSKIRTFVESNTTDLEFITNYTTKMTVTTDGRVGIGITTPAVNLDIATADNTQIRLNAATNGIDCRLVSLGLTSNVGIVGTYSNHAFVLNTNAAERMRITADGNVGIGTTAPFGKFQVGDNSGGLVQHTFTYTLKTIAGNTWYRFFTFTAGNQGQTANIILRNGNGHDSVEIKLSKHTTGNSELGVIAEVRRLGSYAYTRNITKVRICDDGVNQATHLEFQVASTLNLGSSNQANFGVTIQGSLKDQGFTIPDLTPGGAGLGATKEIFISDGVETTNNQTVLGISTLAQDLFYIKGTGNVGIGTNAPGTKLHVLGGASTALLESASQETALDFKNTGAGGRQWRLGTGSTDGGYANGVFGLYDVTAATMRMSFNANGAMQINGPADVASFFSYTPDTNKYVGIRVSNMVAYNSETEQRGFYDFHNGAVNVSNMHTIMRADGASELFFSTTPAGSRTVDRRLPRLQINGAGNVGIGTTAPTDRLHVTGLDGTFSTGTRPAEWGGGITTWDLYAGGTIGSGSATGSLSAYMNNLGNAWFGGNVGIGAIARAINYDLYVSKSKPGNYVEIKGENPSAVNNSVARYTLATGVANHYAVWEAHNGTGSPSVNFASGDGATNGMYFSAGATVTDQPMVFRQGSSERMRIHSNGNVGIGVSNPAQKLHVNGNATIEGNLILNAAPATGYGGVNTQNLSGTYITFQTGTAGTGGESGSGATDWAFLRQIGGWNSFHLALDMHDDVNDANHAQSFSIRNIGSAGGDPDSIQTNFTVNGLGNVGIGTSSPLSKLQVEGDIRVANGNYLFLGGPDNDATRIRRDTGNNGIALDTGSTTRLFVADTGRIGIGNLNPGSHLSIGTIGSVPELAIGMQTSFVRMSQRNTNDEFAITTNFSTAAVNDNSSKSSWGVFMGNTGSADSFNIKRGAAGSGTMTEYFWINSTGNVGIGTTTPLVKLDILNNTNYNTVKITAALNSSPLSYDAGEIFAIYNTSAVSGMTFSGSDPRLFSIGNKPDGAYIRSGATTIESTSFTRFASAQAELMRLTSSGNLGIGTTTPSYKLDVVGNIRCNEELIVSSTSNANQMRLVQGNYGLIFRNDGGSFYMLPTNSGDQYGVWNTLRPFRFELATGNVGFNHTVTIGDVSTQHVVNITANQINTGYHVDGVTHLGLNYVGYQASTTQYRDLYVYDGKTNAIATFIGSTGRVGIGTTSPSAKLEVNGDLHIGTVVTETLVQPSIASTTSLNVSTGSLFKISLTTSITTLSFTNVPASPKVFSFVLQVFADGTARTIAWPASVKWPGNLAPTITSTNGKADTFSFLTYDGGTNWYGFVMAQNH